MKISAGEFKSKCLKIMDNVNTYHEEVVITKYGKPVAKLVPYSEKQGKSLFGYMRGSVSCEKDIIEPTGEKWEADEQV